MTTVLDIRAIFGFGDFGGKCESNSSDSLRRCRICDFLIGLNDCIDFGKQVGLRTLREAEKERCVFDEAIESFNTHCPSDAFRHENYLPWCVCLALFISDNYFKQVFSCHSSSLCLIIIFLLGDDSRERNQ